MRNLYTTHFPSLSNKFLVAHAGWGVFHGLPLGAGVQGYIFVAVLFCLGSRTLVVLEAFWVVGQQHVYAFFSLGVFRSAFKLSQLEAGVNCCFCPFLQRLQESFLVFDVWLAHPRSKILMMFGVG